MLSTKKLIGAISISSVLLAGGCATVISKNEQTIHVQAIDSKTRHVIPGARCTIRNQKGTVYQINSNPGSTQVHRGKGKLTAHCMKHGYTQKAVGAGQSFNAWTIVNVLFWPGFIVDWATGAARSYPSYITVLMDRK